VFTGCNRGTATVTLATDRTGATFGPLALTRMSCGEAASGVEAAVATVLDGEVELAIDGAGLTITKGDQALTYRAK
jgi:heat shock protein HslJ